MCTIKKILKKISLFKINYYICNRDHLPHLRNWV